ncbi:MAG: hypothetical protein ACE5D7_00355 [Fidelibacterota bacterium]
MKYVLTAHLWSATLLFLSSISLTIYLVSMKKKCEILTQLPAKILLYLELSLTGIVPLLGLWIIFTQPVWLKFPNFHYKLTFAILAIGLIHWATAKMKKACKANSSSFGLILFLRMSALIFLALTYQYGSKLISYSIM